MKAVVLTIVAMGMLIGLAACNKDSGGGSASAPTCQGYYFNGSYYVDGSGRQVNCADTYGRGFGNGYNMNNCMNYTYNTVNRSFMNPTGQQYNCAGARYFDFVNFAPYYRSDGNYCMIDDGFYPVSFGGRITCVYTTIISSYGIDPTMYNNGGIINANCRGGTFFGGLIPWTFCGPGGY